MMNGLVQFGSNIARVVDLSLPLQNQPAASDPVITYQDHRQAAQQRAKEMDFDPDLLPQPGVHMAHEFFRVGTHGGATHVDSPWHYGPTSGGRPAPTIDQIPLEWFIGPGVVVDCADAAPGSTIGKDDLRTLIAATGGVPRAGDIVLLRTGASTRWGLAEYGEASPGLSARAVRWLLDLGVRVIGTDASSLDPPVPPMVDALKAGRSEDFFPAHLVGRERPFCIIEKLGHVDEIPARGTTIVAAPVLVAGGSGGWCRAFALVPQD